jgi:hypothetical protein
MTAPITGRLAALMLVVVTGVLYAQAPVSRTAPNAPLDDLLAEVRALRAEVTRSANASIRTQLLTARLQLQEQRIYTAARQLTEVQAQLSALAQEILAGRQMVERFESAGVPPDEKNALGQEIARQTALIQQKEAREQQLRGQETELFNMVNTEQARWAEFNARLDEIERTLSAAPAASR